MVNCLFSSGLEVPSYLAAHRTSILGSSYCSPAAIRVSLQAPSYGAPTVLEVLPTGLRPVILLSIEAFS